MKEKRSSLKKLVNKKEVADLIAQFENLTTAGYTICPADENILWLNHENGFGFPIQTYGKTIGWVTGEPKGAFFLSALLSFLATEEYEKKAVGREALERYKEVNLLYDIADKLAANLNTEEVSSLVAAETQRIINADYIRVMIANEKTGHLTVVATHPAETEKADCYPFAMRIAKTVAVSGKAEIIDNIALNQRSTLAKTNTGSLLCAPLKIKERVIGVISVSSLKPSNYTAGDLKLMSAIALPAALAIENAKLYEQLKKDFINTVRTLAEIIEKRDPYTGGHTKRVMEYSIATGKRMDLSGKQMKQLEMAAILHDIGKIGIRDSILLKTDRLTETEFLEIQQHTSLGQEILCHIKSLADIIPGVKHHHERFDGNGYPGQLAGTDIDILARIISVADAFDAMTTDRPYRKGLTIEQALAELASNAGSQFDPEVVTAFFQAHEQTGSVRHIGEG
ncbi:MAG TPA: HD domain-containing phosphohydrolase [Negativicutes bacterium]|jgi:HD-GYP domain-containing protein (c-di-GMP phosphodiesterase class II)